MDDYVTQLFFTLAQLAGIFVGFGALISVSNNRPTDEDELNVLAGVVMMGLYVIIGALIPVGLHPFGFSGPELWMGSAATLLVFCWFAIWLQRSMVLRHYRRRGAFDYFQLVLEASAQLPLILILLPVFPSHSAALYSITLIASILYAVCLMVVLVLGLVADQGQPSDQTLDE